MKLVHPIINLKYKLHDRYITIIIVNPSVE